VNNRPVAIITGASSGIGWETALAYARRSYAVALAARRADRLEELAALCRQAGGEALVAPTDVAKEKEVDAMVARTVETFGRLDVLVNNAGYGQGGLVHELTDRQMRDIFDVNFHGVFYGCKAAAPVMIARGSGHIFNVSSVIGKRGSPLNGAYCATKFAVSGLTDSMRVELAPRGVRVTLVCPGMTDTEFFDHVRGGSSRARSSFRYLRTLMPASAVAARIVRATGKNVPEMVLTAGGKILVFVAHRSPRMADRMMAHYMRDIAKGK
jgi:uncharacterized protein